MQDYLESVNTLMSQAAALPYCAAKMDLYLAAAEIADSHQDVELGFEVRQPLMEVARNLLRGDILTVAFTWCLAYHDREPDRFGGVGLLWAQREVIGQLANIPTISRATLDEMLVDLGRRLQTAGFSRRLMHLTQRFIAPDVGDRDLALAAKLALKQYSHKEIWLDDQSELSAEIEAELFLGNEEQALEKAKPFRNGRYQRSSRVNEIGLHLLLPLLKRKETAEATQLVHRCRRYYRPAQCYYWPYGELIKWHALTGGENTALKMYGECQRGMTPLTDPLTHLHFSLDALVLFDCLSRTGPETVALRLNDPGLSSSGDGRFQVAEMRDWLQRNTQELAELFDRRNGNDYFQQQIQDRLALHQFAVKLSK